MDLTLREFLERYGGIVAVVAALFLLVAVVPANGDRSNVAAGGAPGADRSAPIAVGGAPVAGDRSGDQPSTVGGTVSDPGPGGATVPAGGTASGAPDAGGPASPSTPSNTSGSNDPTTDGPGQPPANPANTPCRADGQLPGFSLASPPCIPVWSGDNGGATAQGVTADTIKIVWYNQQGNAAQQAAASGLGVNDSDEQRRNQMNAYYRYFNLHFETYGREVQVIEYSSEDADEQVLRSDAIAIANDHKPFAVVTPIQLSGAFGEELAARGIICICTSGNSRSFYTETSPYTYTRLPIVDEHYDHVAEYVSKRLAFKPAVHAGLAPPGRVGYNDERRFGLVFLNGTGSDVSPRAQPTVDKFEADLAANGVDLAIDIGYQFDIPRTQQQAGNIVAQLLDAEVNNVIFIGDPITLAVLTREATNQRYNPEWLITGTRLTDSSFFSRTYDQTQWQRAFGVSPLGIVSPDPDQSFAARAAEHIQPGDDMGAQAAVTVRTVETLFQGIHFAGPRLDAATFRAGLLQAPPLGGTVIDPLVKFTEHNPSAIKDFVEVWYDATRPGQDELGNRGVGVVVKANGGRRYQLTQWPTGAPTVFDADPDPIVETDEPAVHEHDVDGHTHDDDPACRSCDFPSSHPYVGG